MLPAPPGHDYGTTYRKVNRTMNIYPDGFNAGPFGSDTEPISVHGRPDGQVWVENDDASLFEGTPQDARKLAEALVNAAGWVERNGPAPAEGDDA